MDVQGIQFCPDCSNMLYPIELPEEKKLAFECKSCKYRQVVDYPDSASCCIHFQDFSPEKTSFMLDPELALDQTLSRAKVRPCEKCGCDLAVFFQNPALSGDVEMSLVYICCGKRRDGKLCGNSWIQGPRQKSEA